MRRAVYQTLLKAPFRIASGGMGVGGFVGSVWPEKVEAVIGGDAVTIQGVSIALLAVAVVYFALLWLLKPGEPEASREPPATGPQQTTHGQHSPNYGRVEGGVHNYYGPPAPAPAPKKPASDRYTLENLEALARVMGGGGQRLGPRVRRVLGKELTLGDERGRCPEMPIWEALHKIAGRIGDTDEEHGFPEARRQFRQAALEGRIEVWGQRDIPPAHMKDERHKGVWSQIDAEHWADYKLVGWAIREENQERPHTSEEELGRHGDRYWNLKVRPEDIRRCWPKPPRTTYDGYH